MSIVLRAFLSLGILVHCAFLTQAQSDWALHSTYESNSPAVYEIRIQVPREHLMNRLSDSFEQMRNFQATYANLISGITQVQSTVSSVERHLVRMEQHLAMIRERMVDNSPEKGAGFAIDQHHIVTLSTVVQDATVSGSHIMVRDQYDNDFTAELKGIDRVTGVAVLKVPDATMTSYVDLARRVDQLPEASFIMTIQRAYDLPPTPFYGMIGGYNRLLNLFELERYVQTSLPLYPNNRGAPVFNPSGHFLGMMVHGHQVSNAPQVTFVMPASIIEDSAKAIIEHGKRDRGYLAGMEIGPHRLGVHVKNVFPETPAAFAGLQPDDLIVGFNGQRGQNVLEFYHNILDTYPNQTIHLEVIRGTNQIQLQVKTTPKL